ncbi:unnamed protein product [Acanthoscelides obtectus]|uniref:Uncharacterized protein n=1 Tax=Acanthoscelides obtectus TaxID=200917 RepID=A0A9P0ME98_ACAOB|nr:unnamed protein product [Acanthoscelides obtectus]CAK1689221.1 hypothetical protein AOBTE_LOCUS37094 [Acanthoscelides obtectus]
MGNVQTHGNLRDTEVEAQIPNRLSRITSNLILSLIDGDYYPCLILRPSTAIKEGLVVYVFHKNMETEIPSRNIIGNMKCLMHCNVSYTDENGNTGDGYVRAVNCSEDGHPLNFFICGKKECKWVSLPFVFLTREQAKDLC